MEHQLDGAWRQFEQTGRIQDYLDYKNRVARETEAAQEKEQNDGDCRGIRDCHPGNQIR